MAAAAAAAAVARRRRSGGSGVPATAAAAASAAATVEVTAAARQRRQQQWGPEQRGRRQHRHRHSFKHVGVSGPAGGCAGGSAGDSDNCDSSGGGNAVATATVAWVRLRGWSVTTPHRVSRARATLHGRHVERASRNTVRCTHNPLRGVARRTGIVSGFRVEGLGLRFEVPGSGSGRRRRQRRRFWKHGATFLPLGAAPQSPHCSRRASPRNGEGRKDHKDSEADSCEHVIAEHGDVWPEAELRAHPRLLAQNVRVPALHGRRNPPN
jgi:hypothetical protein